MSDIQFALCCAVCRKVKDERGEGSCDLVWCTFAEYAKRYVMPAEDLRLSETYCPDCATSYDRLVRYGRAIAHPPTP